MWHVRETVVLVEGPDNREDVKEGSFLIAGRIGFLDLDICSGKSTWIQRDKR